MSISIQFTKEVFGLLHARLGLLGFERRKPGVLTIKMPNDVIGWIGLNKAIHAQKGLLEINPVLGVRNQQIERFVADLTGEKFDEVVPATLAGNIGYLMPSEKYRPYMFPEDGPPEKPAEDLVNGVREYGLPFINRHTDMAALVEGLRTCRFAVPFMADYRIPSALFLLGRTTEAGEYVRVKLAEAGERQDPAALRYRMFAAKFTERARIKLA